MIDVDEVQSSRLLADADLRGAGIADVDLVPLEDLGTAGLMDSDRVTSWSAFNAHTTQKKSPAVTEITAGLWSSLSAPA